jgi:hypothetical protein
VLRGTLLAQARRGRSGRRGVACSEALSLPCAPAAAAAGLARDVGEGSWSWLVARGSAQQDRGRHRSGAVGGHEPSCMLVEMCQHAASCAASIHAPSCQAPPAPASPAPPAHATTFIASQAAGPIHASVQLQSTTQEPHAHLLLAASSALQPAEQGGQRAAPGPGGALLLLLLLPPWALPAPPGQHPTCWPQVAGAAPSENL